MGRACKLREGRLQAWLPWSEHSDRGHARTFVVLAQTFVVLATNYEITASSKYFPALGLPLVLGRLFTMSTSS